MQFVSVAVPVPFLDVLTYQVPEGSALPQRGARVVVPLGKRVVTGIVVDPNATLNLEETALEKIKHITEVLDDEPFLPGPGGRPGAMGGGILCVRGGDALAAAVPLTQAHKTIRIATLTAQGHDVMQVT